MGLVSIDVDKLIWEKLHIHHGDTLPFTGFNKEANRVTLAEIFGQAGYKIGAEIGVRWGQYSEVICQKVPGVKMYCVDPYMPYRNRRPAQEEMDRIYNHAVSRLRKYDATIVRKTSMDAVKDFADGSLDFVYIDAMHEFDPVMMDIISWAPKVRIGGIVSGHDYCYGYQTGVVPAVDTYTRVHNINQWYIVDGDAHDGQFAKSWFWVKK